MEQTSFEVFAWGHGFVGARPTLAEAERLAKGYEGARILIYQDDAFRLVAELGRYARDGLSAFKR